MNRRPGHKVVSIIGPGNWGSSLAQGLLAARVPLGEVIARGSLRHSYLPLVSLYSAHLQADIFWLCVPDAAIPAVARRLVQRIAARGLRLKGKIVVHSSGALGTEALQAAQAAGAAVASVHPMMSFPSRTPVPLQGVPFVVEADPASRRTLNAVIRRVGGRPFAVPRQSKVLYHAVGVLSSPLLVSHLAAAQEAAALAGFTPRQARRLIEPIVRVTLDSFFLKGPDKSFSGPIARGDVETIRLHLQALEPHPMLADVYRSLALYALEELPSRRKKALRRTLRPTA